LPALRPSPPINSAAPSREPEQFLAQRRPTGNIPAAAVSPGVRGERLHRRPGGRPAPCLHRPEQGCSVRRVLMPRSGSPMIGILRPPARRHGRPTRGASTTSSVLLE
jgi:hypothetical protein